MLCRCALTTFVVFRLTYNVWFLLFYPAAIETMRTTCDSISDSPYYRVHPLLPNPMCYAPPVFYVGLDFYDKNIVGTSLAPLFIDLEQ